MDVLERELTTTSVDAPEAPRDHLQFLMMVLLAVATVLWLLPLASSLWIDETGSYWIVQGSLSQTFHRALESSGSIPYFFVLWIARVFGGTSEVILRMPSVVSMAAATFLLYRLGKRLFDREAALLGAIAFAASGQIAFAAADARPYAMAILALVGATLFLVRWTENGRVADATAYVLLAALTVSTQYLIAVALLAHIPYALKRRRPDGPVSTRQIVLAATGVALLAAPAIPNIWTLWSQRALHTQQFQMTVDGLVRTLAPVLAVLAAGIGLLVTRLLGPVAFEPQRSRLRALTLLTWWAALPPTVIFTVSMATSSDLTWARYLLSALPPLALLVGWGLRSLTPDRVRRVAATALAVLSILSFVGSAHQSPDGLGGEDWRAAASAERSLVRDPDTPVLFQPPYYEARDLSLLRDPSIRGSLLSPLSIYPMRGRVILLPFWLSSSAERYLEPIVRRDLVRSRRIVLVTDSPADPFRSWLDGRLGTSGFTSHVVGDYGGEVLVVFARSG